MLRRYVVQLGELLETCRGRIPQNRSRHALIRDYRYRMTWKRGAIGAIRASVCYLGEAKGPGEARKGLLTLLDVPEPVIASACATPAWRAKSCKSESWRRPFLEITSDHCLASARCLPVPITKGVLRWCRPVIL